MKKYIFLVSALVSRVCSSPDGADLMEPYRCRLPDEWCTWIDYGWDGSIYILHRLSNSLAS